MLLITGDTYILRREIKTLGGFWKRDLKGWCIEILTPIIEEFIAKNNLAFEEIKEVKADERIDVLIAKAERKVEQYHNRISKADTDFDILEKRHSDLTYNHDYSFITQPCNGHKGMIRRKAKVDTVMEQKYGTGGAMDRKEKAEDKLQYWTSELKRLEDKKNGKWKNAKSRKEDFIKEIQPTLQVGDKWNTFYVCGVCTISKINKKTIRFEEIGGAEDIGALKYYTKIIK